MKEAIRGHQSSLELRQCSLLFECAELCSHLFHSDLAGGTRRLGLLQRRGLMRGAIIGHQSSSGLLQRFTSVVGQRLSEELSSN